MNNSISKFSYRPVLIVFGILLFIASIYSHQIEDYLGKQTNPLVASFFLLYGASNIAAVWYENTTLATLSMILNFCAILFLIWAILPKVSLKNMSWWLIIIFVIMVLLNAYLLYEFVAMMKSFAGSSTHYLFMMLSAMSMVVVGFLALLYNYQYSSKSSLVLVFFVFLLIFSEVFRGIAYYDFAYGNFAVYAARLLLIIGTSLLVHHALLVKDKDEELHKNLF